MMLRVYKKKKVFRRGREHVKGKEETDRTKQKGTLTTASKGRTKNKLEKNEKLICFKIQIEKQQKVLPATDNNMEIRQICFFELDVNINKSDFYFLDNYRKMTILLHVH
jgi:hypothetical protein